jgi:hypothetical protein
MLRSSSSWDAISERKTSDDRRIKLAEYARSILPIGLHTKSSVLVVLDSYTYYLFV